MQVPFLVGADPELMLVNPQGELVSAIGRIPGTKRRPYRVPGGALQRDNVLAEINVDPSPSSEGFVKGLRQVLRALAARAAPNRLVPQAGADYPVRCLQHREARVFGCDPDYDAWELRLNLSPSHAAALPFRSAGGHLHIGYLPETKELLTNDYGRIDVVRLLDVFVGLFGAAVDDDPSAAARRRLYGRAGAHRPKPYGVEYRAAGNFWIRSPELVEVTYQLAEIAVRLAHANRASEVVQEAGGPDRVCQTINEHQAKMAQEILLGPLREYLPGEIRRLLRLKHPLRRLAQKPFYTAWGIK